MNRELLSGDRLARDRWPALFWANRLTLIGAAVCLTTTIALLVYESGRAVEAPERVTLDGIVGAAYVLTALLGIAFMVTGYLRLFLVHRVPDHAPWPRRPRPRIGVFQRLAGAVVFFGAVAAGWIHWGVGTAILLLVVFAVVYLPVLWR